MIEAICDPRVRNEPDMRHQNPTADATTLRDFGLTEISTHEPYTAPLAHRHFAAYVAIVLHGEYTETSVDGTLQVARGDVVIHPAFHYHANVFAAAPVAVLNLPLPISIGVGTQYTRLSLCELRLSEEDIVQRPRESMNAILDELAQIESDPAPLCDDAIGYAWQRLREPQAPKIRRVAAEAGVSTEHLARAFRDRYGLSPGDYRTEHRFRHAMQQLFAGDKAVAVACNSGYSDQSHMTRDFKQRTGATPTQISRQLHTLSLSQN